jgi:hypothetical protein
MRGHCLSLAKEAFDVPALPVGDTVVMVLVPAMTVRRDDRFAAFIDDRLVRLSAS